MTSKEEKVVNYLLCQTGSVKIETICANCQVSKRSVYNYLDKLKNDPSFVVLKAATPGVFGFDKEFRNKLKSQYVDVGIAEEHAVAMTSALAKNGARPIFAVMSSFIQRTYDQLS